MLLIYNLFLTLKGLVDFYFIFGGVEMGIQFWDIKNNKVKVGFSLAPSDHY